MTAAYKQYTVLILGAVGVFCSKIFQILASHMLMYYRGQSLETVEK